MKLFVLCYKLLGLCNKLMKKKVLGCIKNIFFIFLENGFLCLKMESILVLSNVLICVNWGLDYCLENGLSWFVIDGIKVW